MLSFEDLMKQFGVQSSDDPSYGTFTKTLPNPAPSTLDYGASLSTPDLTPPDLTNAFDTPVTPDTQSDPFDLTKPLDDLIQSEPVDTTAYPPPTPEDEEWAKTSGPSAGEPSVERWSDLVAEASRRYGVPESVIKATMDLESTGNPNAVSKETGYGTAKGLMQIMDFHWKNGENPFDPRTNVMKGAEILRDNFDKWGAWDKAFAAYYGAIDDNGNITDGADVSGVTGSGYVNAVQERLAKYGGIAKNAIYQGAKGLLNGAQNLANGGFKDVRDSQFAPGLSTDDAYSACGPAAAAAFLLMYGRKPTVAEAKEAAEAKRLWSQETGMYGPAAEVQLINALGGKAELQEGRNPDRIIRDLRNGNTVIVDTPGHYGTISGYNPETGQFYFGTSATDLKGGRAWMTLEEYESLGANNGRIRASIHAIDPTTNHSLVQGDDDYRPMSDGSANELGQPDPYTQLLDFQTGAQPQARDEKPQEKSLWDGLVEKTSGLADAYGSPWSWSSKATEPGMEKLSAPAEMPAASNGMDPAEFDPTQLEPDGAHTKSLPLDITGDAQGYEVPTGGQTSGGIQDASPEMGDMLQKQREADYGQALQGGQLSPEEKQKALKDSPPWAREFIERTGRKPTWADEINHFATTLGDAAYNTVTKEYTPDELQEIKANSSEFVQNFIDQHGRLPNLGERLVKWLITDPLVKNAERVQDAWTEPSWTKGFGLAADAATLVAPGGREASDAANLAIDTALKTIQNQYNQWMDDPKHEDIDPRMLEAKQQQMQKIAALNKGKSALTVAGDILENGWYSALKSMLTTGMFEANDAGLYEFGKAFESLAKDQRFVMEAHPEWAAHTQGDFDTWGSYADPGAYARAALSSLPGMMMTWGAGFAVGVATRNASAGAAAQNAVSYAQMAGDVYEDARKAGMSHDQATRLARVSGGIQAAIETTPIFHVPASKVKLFTKEISDDVIKAWTQKAARGAVHYGIESVNEGIEEVEQTIVENIFAQHYDKDRGIFEDAIKSFAAGLGGRAFSFMPVDSGEAHNETEALKSRVGRNQNPNPELPADQTGSEMAPPETPTAEGPEIPTLLPTEEPAATPEGPVAEAPVAEEPVAEDQPVQSERPDEELDQMVDMVSNLAEAEAASPSEGRRQSTANSILDQMSPGELTVMEAQAVASGNEVAQQWVADARARLPESEPIASPEGRTTPEIPTLDARSRTTTEAPSAPPASSRSLSDIPLFERLRVVQRAAANPENQAAKRAADNVLASLSRQELPRARKIMDDSGNEKGAMWVRTEISKREVGDLDQQTQAQAEEAPEGSRIDQETGLALDDQGNARVMLLVSSAAAQKLQADQQAGQPLTIPADAEIVRRGSARDNRGSRVYVPVSVNPRDLGRYVVDSSGRGHYIALNPNTPIVSINEATPGQSRFTPEKDVRSNQHMAVNDRGGLDFAGNDTQADMGGGASFAGQVGITPASLVNRIATAGYARTVLEPLQSGVRSLRAALERVTGGTKPDSSEPLDESVLSGLAWMPGYLGTNQRMTSLGGGPSKIKLNVHQILAQALDEAKLLGVTPWSPEFTAQLAVDIASAYAHELSHDAVDAHDDTLEETITTLMETPEFLALQENIEQRLQGMSPQERQAWETDLTDLKENKDSGRDTEGGDNGSPDATVAEGVQPDQVSPRPTGQSEQRPSGSEAVGRGSDEAGVGTDEGTRSEPSRRSEPVPESVPERTSGEVNEDLYSEIEEAIQSGELGDRVRASALVKAYDVSYDEASAILAKLRSDKVIDKNGRVQSDSRGLSVDLPEDVGQTHKKFGLRSGSTMAEVVDALAKAQQESEDGYAHLSGPELVELIPGDSTAKRSFVRALSLDAIRKVGKIGMKYADWYFDYMEEFQRRVGAGGREFAALNAILSAQTKVEAHTEGAIKFMIAAREYLAEHPNGFTLAGREVEIDANSFVSKVSKGRQAEIRKARKEGKPDPTWPARMIKIDEAVRDFIVWLEKPEYDFPMQSPDKVKTAALLYFMGAVDRDSKVASFGGNFFLAWLGAYDRRTTNDIWQGRILGAPFTSNGTGAKKDRFGNKLVSGPFGNANAYEWASAVQLWVAQEMGVVPSRLQAAIWTVGSMLWPDAKDMADNPKLKLIGEQEYEKKIKEDPDYTFEDAITDANERGFYDLPQVDGHEILANKQLAPLATKLRALIAHTPKAGKSDEAIITAVADTALGDEVSQTRDAEYTGAMEPQAPVISLPSEIVDLLTEKDLLDPETGRTPLITQPHQFSVDGDGQVTLSLGQSNRENAAFWAAVFGQALDLDSVSITEAAFDGEEIVALWAVADQLTPKEIDQISTKMAAKGVSVAHDGEVLVLTPAVEQTGDQFIEAASTAYEAWFTGINRDAVKKAEAQTEKTGIQAVPRLREEPDIARTDFEPLRSMRGYTDRVDNPDYERIIDALWYRNVSKGRSDLLGKILGDAATRPRGISDDPYGTPLARGESIVDRIRRERELGADNAAAVSRLDDDFGRGYDGPRTGSSTDTDARGLEADATLDIPTFVASEGTAAAQAKSKQKIVADLLINKILGRTIGAPEPYMTRERKVKEAPISKAYNNYRTAVRKRLKAGREDMPVAPASLRKWADQIQAEVRAELETQRSEDTEDEKKGKPASNHLGVQSAADVRRLIEDDLGGLVPTRTIKNILKKREPYLQGVIDFMLAQRQKVLQGNIKVRDLAKAYYMTVASQGTGWMDVDTFEEKMAALGHPMNIRELGIQAGGDPLLFIETIEKPVEKGRGKNRRTEIITEYKVRPEEAAAAWLFSDTGQLALNKLEEGEFDYDAWFQGAKVRMAYGDDRFLSNNVLGEEGVDLTLKAVNLQTLPQLVERINGRIDGEARTGRNVDEKKVSEILDQEIPRLSGISTGKTGFVKQLFGFGDVPTLDAVALNAWVTGSGRVDFNEQTSNQREAVAAAAKEWISDKTLATWLRNELVKGYEKIRAEKFPGTRSIDPRIFQHIMHHWLWDRAKGDLQTTHKGMMAAESRAMAADDITDEMTGTDWNTSISPSEFIALRNRSERSAFMSEISEDDLLGRDLYVLGDEDTGFTGFALQNGDIQNAFSVPGASGVQAKGLGQKSLMKAISEGGITLDCFDGFLPLYYHQYGFEESGRVAWDDGYAPKNWDYDTYGRPDVVLMYRTGWLQGDDANATMERLRSGKRAYIPQSRSAVQPDWEAASAPRDAALADARRAGAMGSDGEGAGRGLGQGELGANQEAGPGDRGTLDSLDSRSASDATMQRDSNAASGDARAMAAESGSDSIGVGIGPNFFRKEIASRYSGDIGQIAVKELIQNSVDASRDIPGARTDVDVDLQGKTITVSDQGTGMTPEVIGNEFTKFGESKKGATASGGFGTAKVAFLGNSDATAVRTVAKNEQGDYVETVLVGTGDQYLDPMGTGGMTRVWGPVGSLGDIYDRLPESLQGDWPLDAAGNPQTGTRIQIKIRDDAKFQNEKGKWGDEPPVLRWIGDFLRDNMIQNQTTGITVDGVEQQPTGWNKADELIDEITFKGTTYRFYGTNNHYEQEGISLYTLNNGLPQGYISVQTQRTKMPARILVDVVTKVPAGTIDYPWTPDRRTLVDDHLDVVTKHIGNLAAAGAAKDMNRLKTQIEQAPRIAGTKSLHFVNTSEQSDYLYDERQRLVTDWASQPWATAFAKAFEKLTKMLSERAPKYSFVPSNVEAPIVWGLGTDENWLGVNIGGAAVGQPRNVILFNPFHMMNEAVEYAREEEAITQADAEGTQTVEVPSVWKNSNGNFVGYVTVNGKSLWTGEEALTWASAIEDLREKAAAQGVLIAPYSPPRDMGGSERAVIMEWDDWDNQWSARDSEWNILGTDKNYDALRARAKNAVIDEGYYAYIIDALKVEEGNYVPYPEALPYIKAGLDLNPTQAWVPGKRFTGDLKRFVKILAGTAAKTTTHEYTHQWERNHTEGFAGSFGRLVSVLQDDVVQAWDKELTKLLKSGELWKLYDASVDWKSTFGGASNAFAKVGVDERGTDAGSRRNESANVDEAIPGLAMPESAYAESALAGQGRAEPLRGRAQRGRINPTVLGSEPVAAPSGVRGEQGRDPGIDGIPDLTGLGLGFGGRGAGDSRTRGESASDADARGLTADDIPQLLPSEEMQRVRPDGTAPGLDRGRWRDEASPAGWKKLYHGTGATSLPMGLRPSKWGEYGAGLYLTDDAEDAGYWAFNRAQRDNGSDQGANVRPVEVPADFYELTSESNPVDLYDGVLRYLDRKPNSANFRGAVSREEARDMDALDLYSELRLVTGDTEAARALESLGYNAVQAPAGEYVVLPGSVRRIRNALSRDARGMVADDVAFNPAGEARVDIPEAEPVVDAVRKAVVQIYRDQQQQLHLDGVSMDDPTYARSLNERMLTGQYAQDGVDRDNALLGLCAAAADATRYLMELRGMKLTPMVKKRYEADGSSWTHRWLQDSQGRIVDPTADQFTTPEYGWEDREYSEGRAAGFMSQRKDEAGRQMPSQAAEEIADIAAGIMRLRGRHAQSMPSLKDLPEYREMKPSDSRALEAEDTYYHGTTTPFDTPDAGRFDNEGLYGPGYYLTDSAVVASSYAEGVGRTGRPFADMLGALGRWEEKLRTAKTKKARQEAKEAVDVLRQRYEERYVGANVRAIKIPRSMKFIDADATVPSKLMRAIEAGVRQYAQREAQEAFDPTERDYRSQVNEHINNVMQDFNDRIQEEIDSGREPKKNATAVIFALHQIVGPKEGNAILADTGYDGVQHIGGKRVPLYDENNKPITHNVRMVFGPSLDKITNALSGESRGMAADSDPFPLNNQQHVRGYGYLNTSGLSPEAIRILEEASENARQYPEGVSRQQIVDEAAKRLGLSPKQTRAKWLQSDSRTLAREVQVLRNGVMGAMDSVRGNIVKLQSTPDGVTQRDELDSLDSLAAVTEGTQWLVAGRRAAESIGRALNQYKHVAWATRGRRIVETLRSFTQSTSIAASAMDKLAAGSDLTEQDRRELEATADRLDAMADTGYLDEGNDDINALIERMDRGTLERDQQAEPESYGERIMRLTQIADEARQAGDTEIESRVLGERDELLAFITETVAAQAAARNARPDTAARMTERMLDAIIPSTSRGMSSSAGDIDPQILDMARRAMSKSRQKKFDAALAGTKDKNDRRRVEKLYKVGEQLVESYVQGQIAEAQLQSVINGLETTPLGQIAADRLYWLVQERVGSQGAQILMGKGGDMTKREYIAERARIERRVRQNLQDALSAASTQITEESATRARQLINVLANDPSDAQAQAEFNQLLGEIPSRAIAAKLRRSLATQQRLKSEKSVRAQARKQQRTLAKQLRQIARTENAALRQQMRDVARRAGSQMSPQLAERYRSLAKQLRGNGAQGQKQADRLNRSLVRGGLLRYLGKTSKNADEDQLTQAMKLLGSIDPNNPEEIGKLMKILRNGTPWDRLIEWTYIARLSGLSTWFLTGINMTANSMATLALLGYRLPAMAVMDAVTSPLRGGQRNIHFSDVGQAYNGALQALKPAMASAWNIWWNGFDPDAVEKAATLGDSGGLNNEYLTSWLSEFKMPGGGDLGWLGAWAHRLSTRPLQAGDQFFEKLIQTATMHELANAKARRTGTTTQAILGDIGNHLDIIDEMQTRSDYTLLKSKTAWSRAFSMLTDVQGKSKADQDKAMAARIALTLFMPFVRVPMNVAKQGFEYTAPGALYALGRQLPEAIGEYRGAEDANTRYMAERKQADILAKAMGGFALTTISILLYAAGAATGDGPDDPDEYANWKLSHEPRSIWNPITKEWWSYDGLPIAIPFASTINAMERTTDAITKQREKGQVSVMGALGTFATVGMWAGVQGYASAIANSTWAKGAAQALELVSDSNRRGAGDIFSGMAADMTTMVVPNLIANMAGVFDEYERAATTYQEKVMKRLPGLRSMLDVQYDRLGRPEPNVRAGIGKMVLPFPKRTEGRGGPVTDFLDDTDLNLSGPPGTVSVEGSSVSLKPEERRRYQKYAGEMVNKALTNYTQTQGWKDLQAKLRGKNEAIRIAAEEEFRKELITPARKAAKDRVLAEIFSNPQRREEAIKEMRARRGLDAEE